MSYIEREAFVEDVKTEITNLKLNGLKGTPRPCDELYDFIERIEAQPTADVVEVVRCKDCKYFTYDNGGCCGKGAGLCCADENQYCSYGERREECSSS